MKMASKNDIIDLTLNSSDDDEDDRGGRSSAKKNKGKNLPPKKEKRGKFKRKASPSSSDDEGSSSKVKKLSHYQSLSDSRSSNQSQSKNHEHEDDRDLHASWLENNANQANQWRQQFRGGYQSSPGFGRGGSSTSQRWDQNASGFGRGGNSSSSSGFGRGGRSTSSTMDQNPSGFDKRGSFTSSSMSSDQNLSGFDRVGQSTSTFDNRPGNNFQGGFDVRSPGMMMGGQYNFFQDMLPGPEVFSHPSDQFRFRLNPDPDSFRCIAESFSQPLPDDLIHKGKKFENLTNSMVDYFARCQPSSSVMMKKIDLWKEIYRVIRIEFDCCLFVFGSTFNGFANETSDMDMCLFIDRSEHLPDKQKLNMVRGLLRKHGRHFIPGNIELIPAKVPILKFKDRVANLEVDMSVDNQTCVRNTHLLYYYSKTDYRVRPMVLAVKRWAKKNDINDARNQTLSSYVLTLMVLHYLQHGAVPQVVPCLHDLHPDVFYASSNIFDLNFIGEISFRSENSQSLGELLAGFFKYYATKFNPARDVGSVRAGKVLDSVLCERTAKEMKNSPGQWRARLKFEEPFDLTNAARAICNDRQFDKIQDVFQRTHRRTQNSQVKLSDL